MPEADYSLSEDLATMRDAALVAGHMALGFMQSGKTKAWEKSPGNPVTEADLAVNTLLSARLRGARPDYGWLSEETADSLEGRRRQRVWVVDPIDGTRAFMRGDPNWCIGLALVENAAPVASVIYAPQFGELYEARKGGGAYLNGDLLAASHQPQEPGARLITNRALVEHPDWPEPWPDVVVSEPKPNATLYRMALVAAGRWDATLALFRKADWDLAAGALLVHEAGGCVSTHLGEPFRFNQTVPAQRSMLAAGKALHPLLVRRIQGVVLPDPNAQDSLKIGN